MIARLIMFEPYTCLKTDDDDASRVTKEITKKIFNDKMHFYTIPCNTLLNWIKN